MIDKLIELKKQEKEIKTQIEKETTKILEYFNNNVELNVLENEIGKVNYINSSKSISVDIKKVEKNEPELFKELLEAYPKETLRKSYLKVTLK